MKKSLIALTCVLSLASCGTLAGTPAPTNPVPQETIPAKQPTYQFVKNYAPQPALVRLTLYPNANVGVNWPSPLIQPRIRSVRADGSYSAVTYNADGLYVPEQGTLLEPDPGATLQVWNGVTWDNLLTW